MSLHNNVRRFTTVIMIIILHEKKSEIMTEDILCLCCLLKVHTSPPTLLFLLYLVKQEGLSLFFLHTLGMDLYKIITTTIVNAHYCLLPSFPF